MKHPKQMWAIVSEGKPIEWHETKTSANRNVHFWSARLGVPVTVKKLNVNPARKNPTKAQKREKAKKTSAKRRIAEALKNFVRKANPAAKGVVKATKVKGGWNVRVIEVKR